MTDAMTTERRSVASRLAAGGAAIAMLLIATLSAGWWGERIHGAARADLVHVASVGDDARDAMVELYRARAINTPAARSGTAGPVDPGRPALVEQLGAVRATLDDLCAEAGDDDALAADARMIRQQLVTLEGELDDRGGAARWTPDAMATSDEMIGALDALADSAEAGRTAIVAEERGRQRRTQWILLSAIALEALIGAVVCRWVLVAYRSRARHLSMLHDQANEDPLTGLANRRRWDHAVSQGFQRTASGHPLSVAIIDLDQFKHYNDLHGHPAGDQMLRDVAQLFRVVLRESDLVARIGGEEFAVLLDGSTAAEGVAIIARLRAGMPGRQTFSAGVARWDGIEPAADLLRRADEALYRAKSNGRDRCEVADSTAQPRPRLAPLLPDTLVEVG